MVEGPLKDLTRRIKQLKGQLRSGAEHRAETGLVLGKRGPGKRGQFSHCFIRNKPVGICYNARPDPISEKFLRCG